MPYKYCQRCNDQFHTKHEWATYCYDCFIERRELLKQFDRGEVDAHTVMIHKMHIDDLRDIIENIKRQHTVTKIAPIIPPPMLRRLIQLTHPDRHANSEAAQTATQWLLEQRGTH